MKKMTCKQIGGACDQVFEANSFDEMAQASRMHAMEMFKQNDAAHIDAMMAMKELMNSPEAMKAWFDAKRKEFDSLPESELEF